MLEVGVFQFEEIWPQGEHHRTDAAAADEHYSLTALNCSLGGSFNSPPCRF